MAWGLWNKVKQGFKKAGKFTKKAADFVTDKVIKPFKPLIGAAASAYNPAFGAAVNTGMNVIEKFSDEGWGSTARSRLSEGANNAASWAAKRFG